MLRPTQLSLKTITELNFWLGRKGRGKCILQKNSQNVLCVHHYSIYSLSLLSRPFLCFLFSALHRSCLLKDVSEKHSLTLRQSSSPPTAAQVNWHTAHSSNTPTVCRACFVEYPEVSGHVHWLLVLQSSQGGNLPQKSRLSSKRE